MMAPPYGKITNERRTAMADNRLWLRHKKTGDRALLAKFSGTDGWYVPNTQIIGDKLDAFFQKLENLDFDIMGEPYELEYENTSKEP
jgi:hypothetical protein